MTQDRAATGSRRRSLTDSQVIALRQDARSGTQSRMLAAQYGISEQLVSHIIYGRRYADVGGPVRAARAREEGWTDGE